MRDSPSYQRCESNPRPMGGDQNRGLGGPIQNFVMRVSDLRAGVQPYQVGLQEL
jgi:hypothetical protein